MKRILTILLMLVCTLLVWAQNISVSSFRLLENDLDANTAGTTEKDQNGEVAALIKVVTTQTGFTFDGGALGIVKTVQKPGEIWVYVPRGLKKITISHSQLGVLRDYYLPMAVTSARTYEMVLVTGTVETTVRQARTSQYVVFQLTPPNAFVELDGEVLQTDGGIATKMMKFGTYNYRVQAPNYLPEAGNVTVNDPNNKHVVAVALKPNFSNVTLKVDGNAEIWVNGERKGTGSWTGNLGAGTYEFETRKPNHRSVFITRDIVYSPEPQIIHLQTPKPILGEADINSSPAMADIYIDEKKVGQTPQLVSDLSVGQHQVRISKQGFNNYSSTLSVREGETSMISVQLEKSSIEKDKTDTSSEFTSISDKIVIKVGKVSFTMVRVDGGRFQMKTHSMVDAVTGEAVSIEPDRQVTLSSYYIGETEVTQELWEAVMDGNPSEHKGKNLPVENISWYDCQVFINMLNQKTGRKFRLPTETEWEFAARGGNKSKGYKFSGSNNLDEVGWFCENLKSRYYEPQKVKTKLANELGLYDMSGNVWEWLQDCKYRGGSYYMDEKLCYVWIGDTSPTPEQRKPDFGLRLAL